MLVNVSATGHDVSLASVSVISLISVLAPAGFINVHRKCFVSVLGSKVYSLSAVVDASCPLSN